MRIPFLSKAKPVQEAVFRRLNSDEIMSLRKAEQTFSDCYLISSLHALTNCPNGVKTLGENIKSTVQKVCKYYFYDIPKFFKRQNKDDLMDVHIFKVLFKDVYAKEEAHTVDCKKIKNSFHIFSKQKNPIVASCEVSMNKLVNRHFFKKPLVSRLYLPFINENFEFNMPSNFMKMFTGKTPVVIGEKDFNINLKRYKKDVFELFEKMDGAKDGYSFVAGTGLKHIGNGSSWHCYVVKNVDVKSKQIVLINKRTNYEEVLGFDEALKKLKYIVGYFNEGLA